MALRLIGMSTDARNPWQVLFKGCSASKELMPSTIGTKAFFLVFAITAPAMAQETGAVSIDLQSCWDCNELTLESMLWTLTLAAGIGILIAIPRNLANSKEKYRCRGISLKLN